MQIWCRMHYLYQICAQHATSCIISVAFLRVYTYAHYLFERIWTGFRLRDCEREGNKTEFGVDWDLLMYCGLSENSDSTRLGVKVIGLIENQSRCMVWKLGKSHCSMFLSIITAPFWSLNVQYCLYKQLSQGRRNQKKVVNIPTGTNIPTYIKNNAPAALKHN